MFEKGKSGNPGGQRRTVKEARRIAADESPESMRVLAMIRDDESKDVHARVAACKILIEQGCGRPKQRVDKKVTHVKRSPRDMSLEELQSLLLSQEASH
jgi:hypothetical protein